MTRLHSSVKVIKAWFKKKQKQRTGLQTLGNTRQIQQAKRSGLS